MLSFHLYLLLYYRNAVTVRTQLHMRDGYEISSLKYLKMTHPESSAEKETELISTRNFLVLFGAVNWKRGDLHLND